MKIKEAREIIKKANKAEAVKQELRIVLKEKCGDVKCVITPVLDGIRLWKASYMQEHLNDETAMWLRDELIKLYPVEK